MDTTLLFSFPQGMLIEEMQATEVRRISGGKGVYLMVLGLSENPMRTQLIPAERLES